MFKQLITRQSLKDFAGDIAFKRGEDYYLSGRVQRLHDNGNKISGVIQGSEAYRVDFEHNNGRLLPECSCPRAADGYFCKHSVALGLAWLDSQTETGKPPKSDPWTCIRAYLTNQSPETLINLLLDTCERDDALYNSLLLKAELACSGSEIDKTLRQAIQRVTHISGFADWEEVQSIAAGLSEILNSLMALLTPAHAPMLIDLCEYAMEHIDTALESIDDSNGEVDGILQSLGDLHLQACEMAKSDPRDLAERLFRLETGTSMGICSFDPSTYAIALGDDGLQRYRQLVQAEFDQLQPKQSRDRFDARRSRIIRLTELQAKADGDIEQLVKAKALDLTYAYHYLVIAEIWANAGQHDKALEWAERGLKAFPVQTDARLRDFLAAAYLQRQRHDEALQMVWLQFEERPSLQAYQKLHEIAKQLRNWPQQRQRAQEKLADTAARRQHENQRWNNRHTKPNTSLELEIALWETDLDTAWTAANRGECQPELLIRLAEQLAQAQRVDDAVQIYQRLIPWYVEQTNNQAYQQAAVLLSKMQSTLKSDPKTDGFSGYVAELRARFKAKRNFIKLLDQFR